MAKVLRAFDYSFDGVTALKATVGAYIDFGDMSAGLEAEAYIEQGDAPAASDETPVRLVVAPEEPADEPPVAAEVTSAVAPEVVADVVQDVVAAPEVVVQDVAAPTPAPKNRKSR